MKILVAVKRVIDYNVQVRVKEDGSGVVTDNVKMSTNPPDDNAIEEAVKIKESGKAQEIVAVTVGEDKAQETVRKALAVGADRGIHVKVDGIVEPLAVSKILQKMTLSITKDIPVNLPAISGIHSATALAAPVEAGMMFCGPPRPPRQSFFDGPSTVG